jgi:tetratricopeptide (TPR) repeat protein
MGSGQHKKFPYVLGALAEACFEGSLQLQEGKVLRSVIFFEGMPVNVISGLQEETLGRILLEEERITPEDYARLLDKMVESHKSCGELLVSLELFEPGEVLSALELQVRRKLLNCFKMADFDFELQDKLVPPGLVVARLDPSEMMFAGIRGSYSLERMMAEFPVDDQTVFTTREGVVELTREAQSPEARVYESIGEGAGLDAFRDIVDDFEHLVSILYGLFALGLVDASGIRRPETGFPGAVPAIEKPPPEEDVPDGTPPELEPAPVEDEQASPKLAEKVLSLNRADHFSVLGIERDATPGEIQSAFYQLLKTYYLHDVDSIYTGMKDRDFARQLLDRATVAYRELSDEKNYAAYLVALEKDDGTERAVPPRVLADIEAQKGELALGTRRYPEAQKLFSNAIDMYPVEPGYYHKLGLATYFQALEDLPAEEQLSEEVREPFETAIVMNPRYDPAHLYLGYISRRNGELDKALEEFCRALECNPDNELAREAVRSLEKQLEEED